MPAGHETNENVATPKEKNQKHINVLTAKAKWLVNFHTSTRSQLRPRKKKKTKNQQQKTRNSFE